MESIWQMAEQHGLGMALAIGVFTLFSVVIKALIKNHQKDRELFINVLNKKDDTINNHITHCTNAINDQKNAIDIQGEEIRNGIDRIERAIKNQTNIIKLFWTKEEVKKDGT
jgi:hypothetical protein